LENAESKSSRTKGRDKPKMGLMLQKNRRHHDFSRRDIKLTPDLADEKKNRVKNWKTPSPNLPAPREETDQKWIYCYMKTADTTTFHVTIGKSA